MEDRTNETQSDEEMRRDWEEEGPLHTSSPVDNVGSQSLRAPREGWQSNSHETSGDSGRASQERSPQGSTPPLWKLRRARRLAKEKKEQEKLRGSRRHARAQEEYLRRADRVMDRRYSGG